MVKRSQLTPQTRIQEEEETYCFTLCSLYLWGFFGVFHTHDYTCCVSLQKSLDPISRSAYGEPILQRLFMGFRQVQPESRGSAPLHCLAVWRSYTCGATFDQRWKWALILSASLKPQQDSGPAAPTSKCTGAHALTSLQGLTTGKITGMFWEKGVNPSDAWLG